MTNWTRRLSLAVVGLLMSAPVAAQTIPEHLDEINRRVAAIRAQLPQPCTFVLSSAAASVSATSGSGTVGVTTQAGCTWTSTSNQPWATISSGATGSANATYMFQTNPGAARSAVLTIAGQQFTLNQAAAPAPTCTYSISPTGQAPPASGGSGGTTVTTVPATGCSWTAVVSGSASSWLSVTSGASGNGSGPVGMTAAANSGSARVGTVLVAGQTFTVSQAGTPTPTCSVTLSPTSASVPATASTGSIGVTATPPGCAWAASSAVAWLTVGAGGSSPLSYTVAANTGNARTGSLTIGGRTFTVNQAGTPPPGTDVLWEVNESSSPLFGLDGRWGTQSSPGVFADYTMTTLVGGGATGQNAIRFTYRNGGFQNQGYLGGEKTISHPAMGESRFIRGRLRVNFTDANQVHTAKHLIIADGAGGNRPILTWGTHFGAPAELQMKLQIDGGANQILGRRFARNEWMHWQIELNPGTGACNGYYKLWTNNSTYASPDGIVTGLCFSAAQVSQWGSMRFGFFHNDPIGANDNLVVDVEDWMAARSFDPNHR